MNDEERDTKIAELEARIRVLERYLADAHAPLPLKKESIGEFIGNPFIKGYYDKTLSIAYFKEILEGLVPLTSDIIEKGYKDAKEPLPKNLSDTFYENYKRHYIMPYNPIRNGRREVKTFTMTRTGVEYAESLIKKAEGQKSGNGLKVGE